MQTRRSLHGDRLPEKAGLKEFQLSVGHAEFFRGLTDAAGLKEEQEEELHDLISNKNYFGVTELLRR